MHKNGKKSRKRELIISSCQWFQIRCRSGKLRWICPSICKSLNWQQTESPWPFIWKGTYNFAPNYGLKSSKASYSCFSEPTYVAYEINFINYFILYKYPWTGNKQMPHDHLFWKSGPPNIFFSPKWQKIPQKVNYHCASETKYVADVVNCTECVLLYAYNLIGNKQKLRDHLFQKLGQLDTSNFAPN